jgi:hypothetical protein
MMNCTKDPNRTIISVYSEGILRSSPSEFGGKGCEAVAPLCWSTKRTIIEAGSRGLIIFLSSYSRRALSTPTCDDVGWGFRIFRVPRVVAPITNHQSPITNHQSPITNHQSPITANHQTPVANQKSLTSSIRLDRVTGTSPLYRGTTKQPCCRYGFLDPKNAGNAAQPMT